VPDIQGVSHNGVRRIYRVLCHIAWCDGRVADQERSFLQLVAARFQIPEPEAAALEVEGGKGEKLGVGRRAEERALMVESMIDIAMADGVLATEEQERLAKFAITFGLSSETLAARIVSRLGEQGRKLKGS
jgi:uncharacterized tellurite resistance protein B-like protein